MRYYAIVIDGAPSAFPTVPGALVSGAQFSSVALGQNDPGALRCIIYIERVGESEGTSQSFVRIFGVSLQMLNQASQLSGKGIKVYGGMFPGLPLATEQSQYSGLLVQGQILAGFGNWQGTDMTLDLLLSVGPGQGSSSSSDTTASTGTPLGQGGIGHASFTPTRFAQRRIRPPSGIVVSQVTPSPVPSDFFGGGITSVIGSLESILSTLATGFGGGGFARKPVNIIHNMQPGQQLSAAMQQTLKTAFPQAQLSINISPNLKLQYQDAGFYQSLNQYAGYVKALSLSIMGTQNYAGITMWTHGNTIYASDQTQQNSSNISINAFDLIGQPTWIGSSQINFKTVMRSDIMIGKTVTLPQGILVGFAPSVENIGVSSVTNTQNPTNQLSFSGNFNVISVIEAGDSRHPDSSQWCTVVTATAQSASQPTPSLGGSGTPTSSTQGPNPFTTRKVRRYARSADYRSAA